VETRLAVWAHDQSSTSAPRCIVRCDPACQTFTIAASIPIALFMGLYMYRFRKGKVGEASAIGVALLVLALLWWNRDAVDDSQGEWAHAAPSAGVQAQPEHPMAFLRLPSVWLCFSFFFFTLSLWFFYCDCASLFINLGF